MKSKVLFIILVILVFGGLFFLGFLLIKSNPYLFILVEVIALLSVILFINLYNRLIRPYQIITDSIDILKEQNFSTRLTPVADYEANKLIEIFNKMMDQLKNERLSVREKNSFLDLLIQASPQGVIILDFEGNITEVNPAALHFLNIQDSKSIIRKKISETNSLLGKELAMLQSDEDKVIRDSNRMYRCTYSSFFDRGFQHPFILIEELTHELMEIEKKSYESIIRIMAHEVNNSMGAISATLNVISDSLKSKTDDDLTDVLPVVDASFNRCQHLSRFISNYAEVVKIPKPSLSPVNINELVRSVEILTYIECRKRNIRLSTEADQNNPVIHIDAIQFEQVLVNIIKNAYEAIKENGDIYIITSSSPRSIIIKNNGPEIPEEIRSKLFTPFFTTKSAGQGIGLMFIREVLINHDCRFNLYSEKGWTTFEIFFPVS